MTDNNNNSLGFTTAEEAALFSDVYDTPVDEVASDNVLAENAPVPSEQIPPEVAAAFAKEKAARAEEWLPKMTVRVNGREVHGKAKNRAIIVLGIFVVVFFGLFIFAFSVLPSK